MQAAEAKVWDRDAVIALINSSNLATGRALWSLYERQTADEQANETTTHHNGVGFNGRDAEFLSRIAKRLPSYGFTLTDRQLPHVRRKLVKYTRQLLEIIETKGGKVEYKKKQDRGAAILLKSEVAEQPAQPDDRKQFGLF